MLDWEAAAVLGQPLSSRGEQQPVLPPTAEIIHGAVSAHCLQDLPGAAHPAEGWRETRGWAWCTLLKLLLYESQNNSLSFYV